MTWEQEEYGRGFTVGPRALSDLLLLDYSRSRYLAKGAFLITVDLTGKVITGILSRGVGKHLQENIGRQS